MRIAVDATTICDPLGGEGAGIEHYTRAILAYLICAYPEVTFVLAVPNVFNSEAEKRFVPGAKNVRYLRPLFPKVSFFSRHIFLPTILRLFSPVLFCPSGQVPFGWWGKSVITIHDLTILEHPEWFADLGLQDFSTQVIVPRSIKKTDAILTVSEATQSQVERLFPQSAGKTRVIYEGVKKMSQTVEQTKMFPYDREYVLYLGTLEPRKNLVTAIEAFDLFLTNHPEQANQIRFILAGRFGWETAPIEEAANRVNAKWQSMEPQGVVQAVGPVSEEEKWNLLSHASVFFFPSFYEGFGLPILEAMSAGAPVITTAQGALAEIGGDAVLSVDPLDREQMSFAIAQCLFVPEGAEALRKAGREQARKFSWDQAAKETMEAIQQVAAKKKTKKKGIKPLLSG